MVRIVSADGQNLQVLDDEGKPIPGVKSVELKLDAGRPGLANIRVWSSTDWHGGAVFTVADPNDGGKPKQVKRIEFEDGSTFVPGQQKK